MNIPVRTLFTPADFSALSRSDLSQATCVVFDILRATTSMVTAIYNGAKGIVPVEEIREALDVRQNDPDILLAGEREGRLITRSLTGSIDFDLGNSPLEFTPSKVAGKFIVTTTTNGTRALKACRRARQTLLGAFVSMLKLVEYLTFVKPEELVLVCSGTHEEAALEDIIAAGALFQILMERNVKMSPCDATLLAASHFQQVREDLVGGIGQGRNGKRLLSIPELAADVAYAACWDCCPILAAMEVDGYVRSLVVNGLLPEERL